MQDGGDEDQDDSGEAKRVHSTKPPLENKSKDKEAGKRDLVIQSARSVLDSHGKKPKLDEDLEEKFRRYVASELRNIENIKSHQIAKLKIQQGNKLI